MGTRVVAALVALVAGFFVAAAGSRLAWEAVPDLPSGARLAEITGTVHPGLPVEGERTAEGLFFDPMRVDTGPGTGRTAPGFSEDFEFTTYRFGPAGTFVAGDYRAWTDATARRLTGAGWTVREVRPLGATDTATGKLAESGRMIIADRDGLAVAVEAETAVSETPAGSFFTATTVHRLSPWYVRVAALAGWLLGGLLGWLVTVRAGRAAPRFARACAVAAIVLLLPSAVAGLIGTIPEWQPGIPVHQPFWALSMTWGQTCTLLGLALGMVALAGAGQARLRMPSRAKASTLSR